MFEFRRLLPIGFLALTALCATGATPPRFTGEQSCASSSCHGGGKGKDEFQLFSKKDIHNHAHQVLANNRSTRIGESLGITDVTKDARCTVCHSPQQSLALERFAAGAKPAQGVSCESCHGAAENWLRFHTRLDITHDQRVGAGLREVKSLYARSNVCVACHLNIDQQLVTAGHPELMFEMDGQTRAEPPHWKEETDPFLGPRTWLVGQASDLREISWKLTNAPNDDLAARWRASRWLLKQIPAASSLPADQLTDYRATQSSADRLARSVGKQPWTKDSTLASLKKLSALGAEFRDPAVPAAEQRRRAELLVPAIDRHWQARKTAGLTSPTLETALTAAATETKAQAAFKPDRFAAALEQVEVAMELLPK
ncbi:MAG TPA: multiheme c-type cytochrome [Chthoniobacteraceae bacterium]|nr:multiheme c-type cytochrome [Chthoniobacteraceae bacterium]